MAHNGRLTDDQIVALAKAWAADEPVTFQVATQLARWLQIPLWLLLSDARCPWTPELFVIYSHQKNGGEAFQEELGRELGRQLSKAGVHPVEYFPGRDFDGQELRRLQAEVKAHRPSFVGGIMVLPVASSEQVARVHQFVAELAVPVVVLDRNAEPGKPELLSYVAVSDAQGGALAGAKVGQLAQTLSLPKGRSPQILVVTGPAKRARVDCCLQVQAQYARCEVTVRDDGGMDRATAMQLGCDVFANAAKPVDILVTTSAPMAVGMLDAAVMTGRLPPEIVSYDVVKLNRLLLASGAIAGAVLQDTRELARAAVEQLLWQISWQRPSGRNVWVPPRLVHGGSKAEPSGAERERTLNRQQREELLWALEALAGLVADRLRWPVRDEAMEALTMRIRELMREASA